MSENGTTRVQYFDHQFLRRQDFSDEQAYHLAMRRRHNISHHNWGIVTGLSLIAEEENVFVQPGMAIDGYGRELILQERRSLPLSLFDAKDTDTLDVWLLYDLVGSDPAQPGYVNTNMTDQVSFYRWQEFPRFLLTKSDPDAQDRRRPEDVPDGDLDFPAYRPIPDDPDQTWPVFLGQMTRERKGEPPTIIYNVNLADRPYIGLVGEGITAPSGLASVQIGNEIEESPTRFAVHIPAKSKIDRPAWLEFQAKEDGDVAIDIRGDTTFHGNIHVVNGGLELGLGAERSTDSESWRIYRHLEKQPSQTFIPQNADEKQELFLHQLRLEMARGRQNGKNQVVIGTWSADEKQFKPCVTIDDRQTMTVHGDLIVQGRVIEPNVRPAANMSGDARNLTQVAALSGMSGASQVLGGVYQSPFSSDKSVLANMLDNDAGRQQVIDAVLETNDRSDPFFSLIVPQGLSVLGATLTNDTSSLDALLGILLDKEPSQSQVIAFVVANQLDKIISIVTTQHTTAIISSLLSEKSDEVVARVVTTYPNEVISQLIKSPPQNFVSEVVQKLTSSVLNRLSSSHADQLISKVAGDKDLFNKLIEQEITHVLSVIATDSEALGNLIGEYTADVSAAFGANVSALTQLITEQATAVFSAIYANDQLFAQFVETEPDKIIAAVAGNDEWLTSLINDHAADVVPNVIANQTRLVADAMWDDQDNLQTLLESLDADDTRVDRLIELLQDDQFAALKDTLSTALADSNTNDAGTP